MLSVCSLIKATEAKLRLSWSGVDPGSQHSKEPIPAASLAAGCSDAATPPEHHPELVGLGSPWK